MALRVARFLEEPLAAGPKLRQWAQPPEQAWVRWSALSFRTVNAIAITRTRLLVDTHWRTRAASPAS